MKRNKPAGLPLSILALAALSLALMWLAIAIAERLI